MLGEQIKKLRIARNMNQTEFGKAFGVSKQTISNWENDNIMPSVEMLVRLAKYFECSTDFLLGLDEGRRDILEVSDLTIDQAAHIQRVINDLRILNRKNG